MHCRWINQLLNSLCDQLLNSLCGQLLSSLCDRWMTSLMYVSQELAAAYAAFKITNCASSTIEARNRVLHMSCLIGR